MRLALVQMRNLGTLEKNREQSLEAIQQAAKNDADLVLFPEVHLTEFFPQYSGQNVKDYEITMDSQVIKSFRRVCRENHIMAVPNVFFWEQGKTYDASILIDAEGVIQGVQKMVHVAQAEQFFEQDYYTPSDDGFHVYDTKFGKIGIVVCFDRHYPESIRTEALYGADLILIPTVNTKTEPSQMFEWELRVQAFQNSVAIAMCNRVGQEENMVFSGESIVIDADGNVLAKAGDEETILYVDVDLTRSKKIRDSRPYTQLRRPEWYE